MSIPAMTSSFNAEMCRKALRILFEPDAVVELRAVGGRNGTNRWNDPVGGFYDDHTRLVQDAGRINGNYAGVYVTLNPPRPETLAWSKNRLTSKPRKLTGDTHVASRRWLYLDFDPVRMSDVSATGDEQEAAFCRAREVREWLTSRDWPEPVRASSGNGAHLLYRIDEPNSDESRQLVMDCLKSLSFRFSDDKVDVDVKTGNASRIVKLYGSLACKGDEIEGRPHRLSLDHPRARSGRRGNYEPIARPGWSVACRPPAGDILERQCHLRSGCVDGLERPRGGERGNVGHRWVSMDSSPLPLESRPYEPLGLRLPPSVRGNRCRMSAQRVQWKELARPSRCG